MKLLRLRAKSYRSLYDVRLDLNDLNLFIGSNASGKSTVLDTLRFLHEGLQTRDFRDPVFSRGGILNLPWKGTEAKDIELRVDIKDVDKIYDWRIQLVRNGHNFHVEEQVQVSSSPQSPPAYVLEARGGEGWWWSGEKGEKVYLKQKPTACALAAAEADASFPARDVAKFVERWGFFDPSPFLLRRDWVGLESSRFDAYGRNLAETLYGLPSDVREQVVAATRDILGLPTDIEPREAESRFVFVQNEPGLQFPVHQMGVSSGTLRILALMTALLAEPEANLIGIEEPENYVHPTALRSFVDFLVSALDRVQFMVTTHSPLLLDYLNEPASICVVKRRYGKTSVSPEKNPDGVRHALAESGFGLGEFHQTKGFGA